MKISIITVTLNSETTIRDTLNSVNSQTYKNIEHIIVDGGSDDETLFILKRCPSKKTKLFVKKNFGIYESINYAIKKSTGKYVCILNSDDIFQSNTTLEKLMKIVSKNKKIKVFLGNVAYFDNSDYYNVTRFYTSSHFKSWKMKFGLMPPHPASLIRKDVYNTYGTYNKDFKIAADFELFLRIFIINKISFKIVDTTIVRMRSGGISGKNLKSYWISTIEILKSFEINKLRTNIFFIIMRIPAKINQLFIYNKNKINNTFKLFNFLFENDYYQKNSFKIIDNAKKIPFKNNFILSGMNLAFLGYFANKELFTKKILFHWPDGIWLKKHINIKKIPGRNLIRNLKIPKNINKIIVLGNLSNNSKKYLEKKFKLKVYNQKLPFGNIKKIIKTKISLMNKALTLITLPTPKQEKLAYYLSEKNSNYKIICIGASIAIASGEEKQVPNILKNYEFLWRLRNDFFRRSKRILETFFYYLKGRFVTKAFHNTRFIKID
tara:strand:+ start:16 stop:1491 length:1476 start_codon:yes stop_codon:yes gene_type:complete